MGKKFFIVAAAATLISLLPNSFDESSCACVSVERETERGKVPECFHLFNNNRSYRKDFVAIRNVNLPRSACRYQRPTDWIESQQRVLEALGPSRWSPERREREECIGIEIDCKLFPTLLELEFRWCSSLLDLLCMLMWMFDRDISQVIWRWKQFDEVNLDTYQWNRCLEWMNEENIWCSAMNRNRAFYRWSLLHFRWVSFRHYFSPWSVIVRWWSISVLFRQRIRWFPLEQREQMRRKTACRSRPMAFLTVALFQGVRVDRQIAKEINALTHHTFGN